MEKREGGLSQRVGGLLPDAFLTGGNRKCWAPPPFEA